MTIGPEMGAIVLRLIPEAVIRGKVTGEGMSRLKACMW